MKVGLLLIVALFAAACGSSGDESTPSSTGPTAPSTTAAPSPTTQPSSSPATAADAPVAPQGDLDANAQAALDQLLAEVLAGSFDAEALDTVIRAGDPRVAWALSDLMRFFQLGEPGLQLIDGFHDLTGMNLNNVAGPGFVAAVNQMIAWDLPAWDEYPAFKKGLFTAIEPQWASFFDENVSIDWRLVTWGGVFIDDSPAGTDIPCSRGCIPALDDPATTTAEEGSWYPDDSLVFGLDVNGEALALPKHQMEVHEMVNLTLGGVRLGIPYCTLCGSAQAYKTEGVPQGFETATFRTSGLLSRSNKMMYDIESGSVIDTFTGEAVSGPLGEAAHTFDQVTVVASTWGAWKAQHPDTRILAEDGGIGRVYPSDPLGGRDDDGPIFPTGPVDPRLPVMEPVVGAFAADGTPVAFRVESATAALSSGQQVSIQGLNVETSGSGLRVVGPDGEVPSHQAFWFAWSQFHPDTLLWDG